MSELKLGKLPDRTPVKITITVSPNLSQALRDYAAIYRTTYGEAESVADEGQPRRARAPHEVEHGDHVVDALEWAEVGAVDQQRHAGRIPRRRGEALGIDEVGDDLDGPRRAEVLAGPGQGSATNENRSLFRRRNCGLHSGWTRFPERIHRAKVRPCGAGLRQVG